MRRTLSFFIGVVVGGLVGATLALLFTPEPGDELRGQIRDRAQAFADEVKQAASTKRIELQQHLDNLRAPHQ